MNTVGEVGVWLVHAGSRRENWLSLLLEAGARHAHKQTQKQQNSPSAVHNPLACPRLCQAYSCLSTCA